MLDKTAELLRKLTRAVSHRYKGNCAPGITISMLPNNQYYVSICSYGTSHKDKKVMHKTSNERLENALTEITKEFLKANYVERNPVDELNDFVSGKKASSTEDKSVENFHDVRCNPARYLGESVDNDEDVPF